MTRVDKVPIQGKYEEALNDLDEKIVKLYDLNKLTHKDILFQSWSVPLSESVDKAHMQGEYEEMLEGNTAAYKALILSINNSSAIGNVAFGLVSQ